MKGQRALSLVALIAQTRISMGRSDSRGINQGRPCSPHFSPGRELIKVRNSGQKLRA